MRTLDAADAAHNDPVPMPVFRSIPTRHRLETDKVRGSRFIASATPIEDEPSFKAFLDGIREEMPDATHHCWAYRVEGDACRSSDDGEPRGSAGVPILNQITGLGLERTGVVVTRYYGGTKLGTGGLVRAYGGAAREALEAVGVVERRLTEAVTFEHPYELSGAVASVLVAHGLEAESSEYGGSQIRVVLAVPTEQIDAFCADLLERTAGRVRPG